jgi:hypothetical protein
MEPESRMFQIPASSHRVILSELPKGTFCRFRTITSDIYWAQTYHFYQWESVFLSSLLVFKSSGKVGLGRTEYHNHYWRENACIT